MHCIFLQLGRSRYKFPRGFIWSKSLTIDEEKNLEKYCKTEKVEILKKVDSYDEVYETMKKWNEWLYENKVEKKGDIGSPIDAARTFFKKRRVLQKRKRE